uniref:Uncharacterized protein n=1 Tax=Sphaerodactylus townsendi TaxID=933632 RepID=A0ACB8ESY4_9SAUR
MSQTCSAFHSIASGWPVLHWPSDSSSSSSFYSLFYISPNFKFISLLILGSLRPPYNSIVCCLSPTQPCIGNSASHIFYRVKDNENGCSWPTVFCFTFSDE